MAEPIVQVKDLSVYYNQEKSSKQCVLGFLSQ